MLVMGMKLSKAEIKEKNSSAHKIAGHQILCDSFGELYAHKKLEVENSTC